jgi:hypothetical protein
VREVIDHPHDLSWLDRFGEMHLEARRQRLRPLFIARMRCDSTGGNRREAGIRRANLPNQ